MSNEREPWDFPPPNLSGMTKTEAELALFEWAKARTAVFIHMGALDAEASSFLRRRLQENGGTERLTEYERTLRAKAVKERSKL